MVAKQIRVPVRNGHYFGWKVSDKKVLGMMLQSGPLPFDGPNQVFQWYNDQLEKPVSFTIEIFETHSQPNSFRCPKGPDTKCLNTDVHIYRAQPDYVQCKL
jgi:hypothetical protein